MIRNTLTALVAGFYLATSGVAVAEEPANCELARVGIEVGSTAAQEWYDDNCTEKDEEPKVPGRVIQVDEEGKYKPRSYLEFRKKLQEGEDSKKPKSPADLMSKAEVKALKEEYKKECPTGEAECIFHESVENLVERSKPQKPGKILSPGASVMEGSKRLKAEIREERSKHKPLNCEDKILYLHEQSIDEMCIRLDKKTTAYIDTTPRDWSFGKDKQTEIWLYEGKGKGKITYFRVDGNKLSKVEVKKAYNDDYACDSADNQGLVKDAVYGSMGLYTNDFLDISNPNIREAAEAKFCKYLKKAVAKYQKTQKVEKKNEVQNQLDLLK